jgi:flagellar protein FlbD
MVTLTRLTGSAFALNPDLVERADCTPDTVITLVDGTKYLVRESVEEVVEKVLDYRAKIIALASAFEQSGGSLSRRNRLSAVPTATESTAAQRSDGPVVPMSPRQA